MSAQVCLLWHLVPFLWRLMPFLWRLMPFLWHLMPFYGIWCLFNGIWCLFYGIWCHFSMSLRAILHFYLRTPQTHLKPVLNCHFKKLPFTSTPLLKIIIPRRAFKAYLLLKRLNYQKLFKENLFFPHSSLELRRIYLEKPFLFFFVG